MKAKAITIKIEATTAVEQDIFLTESCNGTEIPASLYKDIDTTISKHLVLASHERWEFRTQKTHKSNGQVVNTITILLHTENSFDRKELRKELQTLFENYLIKLGFKFF